MRQVGSCLLALWREVWLDSVGLLGLIALLFCLAVLCACGLGCSARAHLDAPGALKRAGGSGAK